MKYIKTYESFKTKSKESVNEELLGGLFKNIKNSLSMGFSKMFGSAAKVNKIIKSYEDELKEAKEPYLENWTERLKKKSEEIDNEDGDESDKADKKQEQLDQFAAQGAKLMKLYNDKKSKIKQKFDLKIKDAIADEDNRKIKNYVRLQKLELEQRLIQYDIDQIKEKTGMSDEELENDENSNSILKGYKNRLTDIFKSKKKESKKLKSDKSEKDKDQNKEIKVGDTVEYTSEKDKNKKFTNKVKSISDDEVEIETKNSGIIKRNIKDIKKVDDEETND